MMFNEYEFYHTQKSKKIQPLHFPQFTPEILSKKFL